MKNKYDFKKQKGMREAVLELLATIRKQNENNKIKYLGFLDFQKALIILAEIQFSKHCKK